MLVFCISTSYSQELNSNTRTIKSISVPSGFERVKSQPNSFGEYLQKLPLKEEGARVYYYHGGVKENFGQYIEVIDLEIGNKDLHQCADAVIRLRAEYLWRTKQYDDIQFNFTNGHRIKYSRWMNGERIKVQGNKSSWYKSQDPNNDYNSFWEYLEEIFMYAGTYSLNKELKSKDLKNMEIGDVLIQGGFPGHAMIIVDMAIHKSSGQKVFLLAQSYMPAQQTHIVTNPTNPDLNPWYELNSENSISTPEWHFSVNDLKSF